MASRQERGKDGRFKPSIPIQSTRDVHGNPVKAEDRMPESRASNTRIRDLVRRIANLERKLKQNLHEIRELWCHSFFANDVRIATSSCMALSIHYPRPVVGAGEVLRSAVRYTSISGSSSTTR
jgi:hypothetical protein